MSAAATVELDGDGAIAAARIALGSVALRPWRLHDAEPRLVGLQPGRRRRSRCARAGAGGRTRVRRQRATRSRLARRRRPQSAADGRGGVPVSDQQPRAWPIAASPGWPAQGDRRGALRGRQPPRRDALRRVRRRSGRRPAACAGSMPRRRRRCPVSLTSSPTPTCRGWARRRCRPRPPRGSRSRTTRSAIRASRSRWCWPTRSRTPSMRPRS